MPYFNLPSNTDSKVSAGRCKGKSGDLTAEGEVVKNDPAGDVGKDRATVLVDREEQVATRVQCQAGNVGSMCEWEGI
jgi:hypothetical protein